MSRFRELVADAALRLWQSRGRVSQDWLSLTRSESILEHSALTDSLDGARCMIFTEQHGSRVIAAPGYELGSPVSEAACKITREEWAASNPEEKKYSLSDLRRAYDMGHHRGVKNGKHCYTNQMRDAALKEI